MITSTTPVPVASTPIGAPDKSAMRMGIAFGAIGALAAAAIIGGAAWIAFGGAHDQVEQTNRVGMPTTLIGEPSNGAQAFNTPATSLPSPMPPLVAQSNIAASPSGAGTQPVQVPPPVTRSANQSPVIERPAAAPVAQVPAGKVGVVTAVREVNVKGDANGVGAVAGGVLGGLLGNQVGGGTGRTAMTVVGAVGGGLAGHEVQKRMNGSKVYNVTVQFDDGTTRTLQESSARGWHNGDRVRVNKNVISAENA